MSGVLVFKSWAVFADSYEPHRRWLVSASVPDMQLEPGHWVYEVDPDSRNAHPDTELSWDGCRFQTRDKGGKRYVGNLKDWQAAQLFGGELPPWPLEGVVLRRLRECLVDAMPTGKPTFATVMQALAKMLEYMTRDVPDAPKPAPDAPALSLARADQRDLIAQLLADYHRREPRAEMDAGRIAGEVFVATAAIPGTPLRSEDLLWFASSASEARSRFRRAGLGKALPRSCFPALHDGLENVRFVADSWPHFHLT